MAFTHTHADTNADTETQSSWDPLGGLLGGFLGAETDQKKIFRQTLLPEDLIGF